MSIPYKKSSVVIAILLMLGVYLVIGQPLASDALATPAPATVQPEPAPPEQEAIEEVEPVPEVPVSESAEEKPQQGNTRH